jgi:Mg-chelatase subunit ChlD
MNPNFSPHPPNPHEEREARVTALLLGELSETEATELRQLMAKDADLAKLHRRLSQTLNLLRETVATPAGEIPAQPAPLKLSPDKREKLLASFKTVTPKEFEKPQKWTIHPLIQIAAVVMSLFVLASMLLPALARAKQKAQRISVVNNLAQIDMAKQMWAQDNNKSATDAPTVQDLAPYLGNADVKHLDNEKYFIGQVGQPAAAEYKGKLITRSGEQGNLATLGVPPQPSSALAQQLALGDRPIQVAEGSAMRAEPSVIAIPAVSGPKYVGNHRSDVPPPGGTITREQAVVTESLQNGGINGVVQNQIVLPQTSNAQLADNFVAHGYGGAFGGGGGGGLNGNPDRAKLPALQGEAGGGVAVTDERASERGGRVGGIIRSQESEDLLNTSPASRNLATLGANGTVTVEKPAVTAAAASTSGNYLLSPQAKSKQAELVSNSGSWLSSAGAVRKDGPVAGATFAFNNNNSYDYITTTANLPAPGATPPAAAPAPALDYYAGRRESEKKEPQSVAGTPAVPQQTAVINGYFDASATQMSQGVVVTDGEIDRTDAPLRRPHLPALVPQPEVLTRNDAFTTFSLNISDVAFKLAQASLQNGVMPDAASMRTEEFINAFDYRDPEPAPGAPIGFACEYASDPFAHNRDFLRFSIKTAAVGRQSGRALNLVLIVDKSGSMERADRVEIISRALSVLAKQLNPQDTLSVIVFARTARLFVDGVPGNEAGRVAKNLQDLTPEGGTNLEEAMKLAYATAMRHYLANGENRVVLLTDGAANLGNVNPAALTTYVESNGKQGIALDCFGVGWEGYNDDLLETISRAGHGRYAFINTPEEAATEFAGKLAGALRVAADDVKVQVEFNPNRVISHRQIGYAKDQLTTEQFRDNNVRAAQIGAAESGNALYAVEINPGGEGPLGTVHVRFRVPGTSDYQEHEWTVDYSGAAVPLEKASPAMRLAATSASFCEWLAGSPYAGEVTPDRLLSYINGVPKVYGADDRPAKLEWMIRQAKSISGK